jgi:hypothetical protein
VIQRLWRGVEGPRRCLITRAARSFSATEARQQDLPRYPLDRLREDDQLSSPATKAGCPIQARFWLEWDTTALDVLFVAIPTEAEGSAVRAFGSSDELVCMRRNNAADRRIADTLKLPTLLLR